MEGNVAKGVLYPQHRIEDIEHPERTKKQKQYDNEQTDRLSHQQPLHKIIPLHIKEKIQELNCVEEKESENDDQDQFKEKNIEVADNPFCGKVVPLADLIHEILKAHFSLLVFINSTLIQSLRNNEFRNLQITLCLFFLLAWNLMAEAADKVRVHFLNVGYADAILVEWQPGSAVLVDAGEAEDAPDILNYLQSAGIADLKAMVITHPHKNHFGSAREIAERIKVGRVFINGDMNAEEGYQELLGFLKDKGIPVMTLRSGDELPGMPDELSWSILHPGELTGDINGNSLVSLIRFRQVSFVLTGDIMVPAQENLLKENPSLRDARCVQVPHHGGPLSDDFFAFFPKAQFVVSTGENPWGLPDEGSLVKAGGKVFRTDTDGTVVAESDGRKIRFTTVGK